MVNNASLYVCSNGFSKPQPLNSQLYFPYPTNTFTKFTHCVMTVMKKLSTVEAHLYCHPRDWPKLVV